VHENRPLASFGEFIGEKFAKKDEKKGKYKIIDIRNSKTIKLLASKR